MTDNKAIEDIEVGDYVWSENPYTGEVALKQVVDTFVYEKDTLVILQINGRTIETITEHPFYVENIGWISAKYLEVGDVLRLLDDSNAVVENVEIKELDSIIKVYNFEVEDFHTYFVGEDRVLVHNDCYVSGNSNNLSLTTSKFISGEVNDHHIIPKFRGKSKKYADFISSRGINVDDYTITVSAGKGGIHMNLLHGKGGWNQKWIEFIDNNPNATAKDIYQFAGKMMDDYGLNSYNIHPYGKK